jgi:hypothetical protein
MVISSARIVLRYWSRNTHAPYAADWPPVSKEELAMADDPANWHHLPDVGRE